MSGSSKSFKNDIKNLDPVQTANRNKRKLQRALTNYINTVMITQIRELDKKGEKNIVIRGKDIRNYIIENGFDPEFGIFCENPSVMFKSIMKSFHQNWQVEQAHLIVETGSVEDSSDVYISWEKSKWCIII